MLKNFFKAGAVMTVLFGVLLFTGCGDEGPEDTALSERNRKALIGSWITVDDDSYTMHFREDGSWVESNPKILGVDLISKSGSRFVVKNNVVRLYDNSGDVWGKFKYDGGERFTYDVFWTYMRQK